MGILKGHIYNYSSKTLWVVETDTGLAKAHKLAPNMKSPSSVDADGVKSADGTPINEHVAWWKVNDLANADIYDDKQNNQLIIKSSFKRKVEENEFGQVEYIQNANWGEKINNVTSVRKNNKGTIAQYNINNGIGWVDKTMAVELTKKGQLEAVLVSPRKTDPYIRSRPDNTKKNNFSNLRVS